MPHRYPSRRLATTVVVALALASPPALAAERLKAVASFSILGDIARSVGGGLVEVTTLVGPDGDAHIYQLSPADAQAVAAARLLVVNGLGFEGWMGRLEEAAGFAGVKAVATVGVAPIGPEEGDAGGTAAGHGHAHAHDHGDRDPHAWHDPANGRTYVANIVAGLAAADPGNAAAYRRNGATYAARLGALDAELRAAVAALPADRRKVVTSHDAFGYLAHAYGLEFLAPQGLSTEAEVSAADVATLVRQIREERIAAVFVENIADPRLLDRIARETGARVGGTLYSDALSGPGGPAPTYPDMLRHNVRTLAAALAAP